MEFIEEIEFNKLNNSRMKRFIDTVQRRRNKTSPSGLLFINKVTREEKREADDQ